jgi:general secretion pathway protein L
VLPGALPLAQPQTWLIDEGTHTWLTRMGPDGVLHWPLHSNHSAPGSPTGALNEVPGGEPFNSGPESTCFATPRAVERAEQLFPQNQWHIQPVWRLWVELAQSGWDLAQFDIRLSTGARREQTLKALVADWIYGPNWKPLRWGLLALAVLQVLGLNAVAAQHRAALVALQDQARQTVTSTFPQITLVLDGPVQMQRELERLRQGRNAWSEQDLESVLERFGRVTDTHALHLHGLDYTPQRVRFAHPPLSEAARSAVEAAFQSTGWSVGFTADGTELQRAGPL